MVSAAGATSTARTHSPDALGELDRALDRLRRFWQRPELRERFLTRLGVPIEASVLRVLRAVETAGHPSVSEIAALLAIDPSTASRLVDRAAGGGYVVRRGSAEDQRRVEVHLTRRGRQLLQRADAVRRDILANVLASWDPEEVALLGRLLHRFIDSVEAPED